MASQETDHRLTFYLGFFVLLTCTESKPLSLPFPELWALFLASRWGSQVVHAAAGSVGGGA